MKRAHYAGRDLKRAVNIEDLRHMARRRLPNFSFEYVEGQTLAEMIGTTRSRVNFFMNKFRSLGFIDYNGVLTIHTALLSVVLHD